MRTINFVLTAIAAILIGIVFFANGGDVVVSFWPDMSDYGLPLSPTLTLSVGTVGLLCGLIGFVLGTMREYLREGGVRRQGRKAKREAEALKSKVDELTADQADDDIPQLAAR